VFTKFFQIIGGPGGFKPSDPNSIFNQFFQNFGGGGGGLDDDFIFSGLGGSRPGGKRRSKNNNTISLYTLPKYEDWKRKNSNGKGWTIEYYKSLGTITTDEAEEYFSDLNKHIKRFKQMDKEDHRLVEMTFTKKNADKRKIWIRGIQ